MVNVQDKQFGRMGNRFFQLAYLYAQFRDGKISDIYLQDYNLFDKYRDEIRELFKQEGEPLDYISVHVRRGKNPSVPTEPNYSENPFYVNLTDTDYYEKAMAEFPNEKFMVFSDDIEWCIENFMPIKAEYKFSDGEDEIYDFNLQTRCKHNIIANSSYSFWCGYLNPNPSKKVVAPSIKNWFTDGVERTVCPPEWIRI